MFQCNLFNLLTDLMPTPQPKTRPTVVTQPTPTTPSAVTHPIPTKSPPTTGRNEYFFRYRAFVTVSSVMTDVRLTKLKAKKVQNVTLVRIEKSTEDWEDIRIIKNRIWRNSATAAVFRCPSRGSPVFGTCQGLLFMLTWDQALFERFSYILCNGYRWNWFRLARQNVIFKAKRK